MRVCKGSLLRFRQDIKLDIAPGAYTFDLGLSTMNYLDFKQRSYFLQEDLRSKLIRLCHLGAAGSFVVTLRKEGKPVQLLHHGLCNLPGSCKVLITQPGESVSESSEKNLTFHSDHSNPTIFHLTHWKAGSQWLRKILCACVPELIVEPRVGVAHFLSSPIQQGKVYPTVYVTKDQFDSVEKPSGWRSFIIIRDLRDTLVSAYFSLKISHAEIAPRLVSLREKLTCLNMEEGMFYLMEEWLPAPARIQESWLNSGEEIIRYEDILTNDLEILGRVLIDRCGLPVSPKKLSEAIIANRFESLTGRRPGEEKIDAHERKGIHGDYKNYFGKKVKQEFKRHYGDLLIRTGYECDPDW